MAGKTARACDGCLLKRARWYCVADDAFLCQSCDSSVHSANQLASRHERVRLEVASSKLNGMVSDKDTAPGWHQGFTRKARTPRHNKALLLQQAKEADKVLNSNESLVPEISSEEGLLDNETTEEQLLYQVPVFDPFAVELDCAVIGSEGKVSTATGIGKENTIVDGFGQEGTCDFDDLHGFLPSDMDLVKFTADVESFLEGGAVDEDSCDVKELGLLYCKDENDHSTVCFGEKIAVKINDEEVEGVSAIDWNFDYESLVIREQEKPVPQAETTMMNSKYYKPEIKKNVSLKLNYDAIITAWASQGCPWTTGSRPDFNPSDCWPDCMGSCCKDVHYPYKKGLLGCQIGGGSDGGREARVSRYREKRRTRLFSKKIRYEVRKLNAEKRPRMKGRFVKRTSFVGTNINAFPNSSTNEINH